MKTITAIRSTTTLVHAADPTLIADAVALRCELEAAVARIIPLLVKVDRIADRACDAAERIDRQSEGLSVLDKVIELCGLEGMDDIVRRLMASVPQSVELDEVCTLEVARVA